MTTLYMRSMANGDANQVPMVAPTGEAFTNLGGNARDWWSRQLSTTRGATAKSLSIATVAGATNGVEVPADLFGGVVYPHPYAWTTPPFAADQTISGSITVNLWAYESSMSANVTVGIRIFRLSGTTFTEIAKAIFGTELGTSAAAKNFSVTPTSTAFAKGDRLVVQVYFDDATGTTMAAGYTATLRYDGPTGAADGDSYITTTETLSFMSAPSGSFIYPTNAAAGIDPGSATEYEAWTSRGGGVQSAVTNTAAGWTAPIQITATGGGTALEWYTKPLAAVTLAGAVLANIRGIGSNVLTASIYRVEIAVTDSDGSNPVVWATGGYNYTIENSSETANQFWIAADDYAISAGKRIRIRIWIDDGGGGGSSGNPMNSGYTVTTYYNGTSAGASGDTYLRFPVTLSEQGGTAQTVTLGLLDASRAIYAPTVKPINLVSLGLLDAGRAIYAPTVLPQPVTATLGLLDSGGQAYQLIVAHSGGTQSIEPGLLDTNPVAYAPTLTPKNLISLGLLDGARAVFAPLLALVKTIPLGIIDGLRNLYEFTVTNAQTPAPLPPTEDARYIGESMAVHVENDPNPSVSANPPAIDEGGAYTGITRSIITNENSPAWWNPDLFFGPDLPFGGYYQGRSEAIHVWGEDVPEWTPEDVDACKCCEEYEVVSGPTTDIPSGTRYWADGADTEDGAGNGGTAPNTGFIVRAGRRWEGSPLNRYFWYTAYVEVPVPATATRIKMDFYISNVPWDDQGGPGSPSDLTFEVYRGDWGTDGLGSGEGDLDLFELVQTKVAYDLGNEYGGFPGTTQFMSIEFDLFPGQTRAQFACRPINPVLGAPTVLATWNAVQGVTFTFYKVGDPNAILGDCEDEGNPTCTGCEDPTNPGFQIPDFTPGYLPTFRYQIGDPTTALDSWICTLESGAMLLDWHTRGAVKVWGGELIPYCGKTEAQIIGNGTNLGNVQQAWRHWGQHLDIRSGGTWAELMACLNEGRGVVLQGDYGALSLSERCQASFEGDHAILVLPYISGDRLLVGDPLCSGFKGRRITSLQAYAEDLGVAVYGVTSPQRILFAVSRPFVP